MSEVFETKLINAQQTVDFGRQLSVACEVPTCIYLHGNLGAGKTTLTRGFIQGLGYKGKVKSPTYTLVEPYELVTCTVYHFDLYRLSSPEELEFMGIDDYFNNKSYCLVEWPEHGKGVLLSADIDLKLTYQGEMRLVTLCANSDAGCRVLGKL